MYVMHQFSVSRLSKDNCQNHDFRARGGGGGRGALRSCSIPPSSVAKRVPLIMILWPLPCCHAGEIKGLS